MNSNHVQIVNLLYQSLLNGPKLLDLILFSTVQWYLDKTVPANEESLAVRYFAQGVDQ
jgi:hypothetical protein